MARASSVLVALYLVTASGLFCLVATSSAVAKHKVSATSKDKSSATEKKHKSVADRKKQKVSGAKKDKSSVAVRKDKPSVSAKEEPVTIPQPRTPVDKQDCIAAAQAFYGKAQTLAQRTNQTVTKEFQQVVIKLDELCGEEEFEKARTSLDWMNLCLQNFTKYNRVEFCSRNAGYFCAVDADTCIASEARAE
jgi:hypothetical protein